MVLFLLVELIVKSVSLFNNRSISRHDVGKSGIEVDKKRSLWAFLNIFWKFNILNNYKPVTGVPGISSAILFVRFVEDAGFFSPFLAFFLWTGVDPLNGAEIYF